MNEQRAWRGLIAEAAVLPEAELPTKEEVSALKAETLADGQRTRDGGDEIAGVARPSLASRCEAEYLAERGELSSSIN